VDSSLDERVCELRPKFYSPFDFGGGVVTKPWYVKRRFKRRLSLLDLPDLTGKTVLDIGAWDGYFSFEFGHDAVWQSTYGPMALWRLFCSQKNTSRVKLNIATSMRTN
jgi:hypothetical protein